MRVNVTPLEGGAGGEDVSDFVLHETRHRSEEANMINSEPDERTRSVFIIE